MNNKITLSSLIGIMITAVHLTAHSQPAGAIPAGKDLIESPLYKNWSLFKIGTETSYQLTIHQGGVDTQMPLHYTLDSLDPDKAVVQLNLPAGTHVTFPAKTEKNGGKAKNQAGLLYDDGYLHDEVENWPQLLYQLGSAPLVKSVSGHETVEAAGQKFNCEWGTTNVGVVKIKQWFSQEVPGKLVKSQVEVNPQYSMDIIITRIKIPSP